MYLYIVMAGNGLFKVGKASNVKERVSQIKTASPVEVEILAVVKYDDNVIDLEKQIHKRYSEKRVRGEWFALSKNDILSITNLANKEINSLLMEMQDWGFFQLGTSELLGNVAKAALFRASAIHSSEKELSQ